MRRAAGGEIVGEQRRRGGAVDVVVAEDRDFRARHDGVGETFHRRVHVGQGRWIGHQVAYGGVEIGGGGFGCDAARGEDAGEDVAVAAKLRDRERLRFAVGIESLAPWAPVERAFDV